MMRDGDALKGESELMLEMLQAEEWLQCQQWTERIAVMIFPSHSLSRGIK
jgi:hypothetical protein